MKTHSPSMLGSGIREVIKSIIVLDRLNHTSFLSRSLNTKGLVKGYLPSPMK